MFHFYLADSRETTDFVEVPCFPSAKLDTFFIYPYSIKEIFLYFFIPFFCLTLQHLAKLDTVEYFCLFSPLDFY